MNTTLLDPIKPIYRYMRYLFLRYISKKYFMPYSVIDTLTLEKVSSAETSFYGYYNLSPENLDYKILYCTPSGDGSNSLDIVVRDNKIEKTIGNTTSYNVQQGCMEQWGYNNDSYIYYNFYNTQTCAYQTKIFDYKNMKYLCELPLPIYSVSKQEDYALSLSFDRLAKMRPDYGYFCRSIDLLPYDKDGIWKIDLNTKETTLIISLETLIHLSYVDTMDGAEHKVNHIDISPDGSRFMFLHRWVGPQGRYMRLITADRNGKNIYILNGDKMTSHSFWIDSNRIVSFCNTELYGDAYVVFTDQSDDVEYLSDELPRSDGHPSFSKDKRWMITDTYPDITRMSYLYLFDLQTKNLVKLGRFYQPPKYKKTQRIDLHPKWNKRGDTIYFESGHNGKRNLYKINLKKIL